MPITGGGAAEHDRTAGNQRPLMAPLIKRTKRRLQRRMGELLHWANHRSPGWMRSTLAPALCYAEMLVFDYGIARLAYNNRHKVSTDVWRSAQPAPHQVAWAARRGVKTIVNLRGGQTYGTRWLEERACERNGIKLIDLPLRSRSAPTRADFLKIKDLLANAEYPMLLHCKSGADRAGFVSVMVRHIRDRQPMKEALKQLSWRYGHFRSADTGVLDAVYQRFLEDTAGSNVSFWDWVDTSYDATKINGGFKAKGWANRLVNDLLRRE